MQKTTNEYVIRSPSASKRSPGDQVSGGTWDDKHASTSGSRSRPLEAQPQRRVPVSFPRHAETTGSKSAPPTEGDGKQVTAELRSRISAFDAADGTGTPQPQDLSSSLNYSQEVRDAGESNAAGSSAIATELAQSLAIQHRQLCKLIEKTLLKRTQLLHEQQKVETCRHFFDESLEALKSAFPTEPEGSAARKKRPRKRRKRGKQNEAVGTEVQADLLQSASSGSRPGTRLSATQQTNESEASSHEQSDAASAPPTSITLNVPAAFTQYRSDYASLRTQEAQMKTTMDELSRLDFRVKELQEAFVKSLTSAGIFQDLHTQLPPGDIESSDHAVSENSMTDTPSLLAEYYSRRGDIGIFRERLEELEFHYHEGLEERAFLADRGDQLEVSDVQFDNNYTARRNAMQRDLEEAEQEADDLADRCLQARINVPTGTNYQEPDRYLRSNESGAAGSLSEVATAARSGSSSGRIPAQQATSSRLVDRWLRDVPESVTDPGPASEGSNSSASGHGS